MAVKLSRDEDEIAEISDINVTPFIDVTLVLLIIFMVAAPLSTVDVPVDLPVSNAAVQPRPAAPIFLTIRRDLSIALGEEAVPRGALQGRLDAESNRDRERRIFLRADQGIAYRDLMSVMNLLRSAGCLKIALVGLEDTAGGPPPAGGASPAGGPPPAAKQGR